MTKVIGITGLIASGKSTLTEYLKYNGYEVFDADFEVKKLYEEIDFINNLRNHFPNIFINGNLNKKLLFKIIFTDNGEKIRLESLVHPIIENRCDSFIDRHKKQKIIFLDVPLLFEVEWHKKCHKVILVIVNKEIQKDRYLKRGLDIELLNNIIDSQYNIAYKKSKSDYVIENSGELDDFFIKIDRILINEIK